MDEKRRDEEDIQDSLVEQECKIVKFPLVPVGGLGGGGGGVSVFFIFFNS